MIVGHAMDPTDGVSHNGNPSHPADSLRSDSRILSAPIITRGGDLRGTSL
jgi:hypothetical protein